MRMWADHMRARGDIGWRTTRAESSFGWSSREVKLCGAVRCGAGLEGELAEGGVRGFVVADDATHRYSVSGAPDDVERRKKEEGILCPLSDEGGAP